MGRFDGSGGGRAARAVCGDRLDEDIDQGAFQFGRFHRLVQDRAGAGLIGAHARPDFSNRREQDDRLCELEFTQGVDQSEPIKGGQACVD